MLDVCLMGTGGMMPLPYRWLTSCMMRYNGSNLLIDCGEGTQVAIKEKGWTFKPIDIICITHFHADHISGLPGLLLTMANSERKEPLVMIGPKGLERVVNCLRCIAPGLPFSIEFRELSGEEETICLNGYEINAFRVNHNVTCYGYNIAIRRSGRFEVEQARKNNIPLMYWNPLQKGNTITTPEGITFTPDMVLGPARKGLSVTYTTDTRPCDSIDKWSADVDLLICEGMYGEEEKQADAKEKKHMMMQEAAGIAARSKAKELWLTHYSPAVAHPAMYEKEISRIFGNVVFAKDGHSKELSFDEE